MNVSNSVPYGQQVYRHHWLKFWKRILFIVLLTALGVWGFLQASAVLGLGLLALALMLAVSLYLVWSWHALTFRPDDDCLIYQRGFFGSTRDVISLLGVITPYQVPIIGTWLDVGRVDLDVVGHGIRIPQIAKFEAFRDRIQSGAQQQQAVAARPIQILIQSPAAPPDPEWLRQLISEPDA